MQVSSTPTSSATLPEDDSFCLRMCSGRTEWYISIFVFPFVLIYNAIVIYLWPCLYLLFGRCFEKIFCWPCRTCCKEYYLYVDNEFPANHVSLAAANNPNVYASSQLQGLSVQEINAKVEWIRASELSAYNTNSNNEMYLFANGIELSDVVQGALGDCWLLAAITSLSESPGSIENCFLTYERHPRGKYRIELYDARANVKKKVVIEIDDFIPCYKETHQPIFSQPKNNEMYVLLLEKAFAKFCGGYSELKGGHAMWAMQAITGDYVFRLDYEDEKKCWVRFNIHYLEARSRNPKNDWVLEDSQERFDHEAIFELLKTYYKNDALMAASVRGIPNKIQTTGIIEGHTYSLRQVVEFEKEKLKMIQLRNPWGSFEWKGDWSDHSPLWKQYPDVAVACGHKEEDNGIFWIEYKDFFQIFNVLQICDRSTYKNLHIDIYESEGYCGVCKGCAVGCVDYWCCCQGMRHFYCGHESTVTTLSTHSKCMTLCCPCCIQQKGRQWIEKSDTGTGVSFH